MKTYAFADLATLSGASTNELKHWVQRGLIRADVKETTGTGAHRTFGFLDGFEACVAQKLNELPGGMPIDAISRALDAIRFETILVDTPWRLFLDPATRAGTTRFFWLCLTPGHVPRVLDRSDCDAALRAHSGVMVFLRLDTLLLDLEARTGDHSTDEERNAAWMKRDPSLVDVADVTTEPRAHTPTSRRAMAAKTKD